jgi:AcrR family transcriptional regulator
VAITQRNRPVTPPRAPSRSVKQRLTDALSTFSTGSATPRATVADLCRRAGVSRNTLYRYYPEVVQAVTRLRRRGGPGRKRRQTETLRALRSELMALRAQVAQLATLADHYHTAAEELRTLLARRDRELAALRDDRRPRAARVERAPPPRPPERARGS